jgi:phosphoglycolate phosphatase
VLFDLDGTLVDSVKDLASAADEMMRQLGHAAPGTDRVRNYVGNGIERLVHRCLTCEMNTDAAQPEFDRALALFMQIYEQHNGLHSTIFTGVREGIEMTARRGLHLGCVTNKSRVFTEPLLDTLDLLRYFEILVCGDTTAHKKPHPAPLQYAMRHWDLQAQEVLFVGDSVHDVQAARAAGMRIICVNYGYNHDTDITEAKPDAVIGSLCELATFL